MEIKMKLPPRMAKGLRDYLYDDEVAYESISSVWSPARGTDYLIFTNKRLIHVQYRFWSVEYDEYPIDDVTFDIDYGSVFDTFNVMVAHRTDFAMPTFPTERNRILGIVHRVEQEHQYKKKVEEKEGFKEKLEKLAELLKEGIITKEEFEEKKKEILSKL